MPTSAAPTDRLDTMPTAWHASVHDPARLGAVRRSGFEPGVADPALDRLAALAAGVARTSIAVVTIVGDGVQYVAGGHGLPAGLDRDRIVELDERSFCARAVHERRSVLVDDVAHLFGDRSAAGHRYPVRAVAAVPFFDVDGYAIGAVCALDPAPRLWDGEAIERLEPVAQLVGREARLAATMPADSRTYRLGAKPPSFAEWMPRVVPGAHAA